MAKMVISIFTKKVITLYINDSSIRLLVAKGKKVTKWATLPLESGLVKDGVVIEQTQVAALIKQFFKDQKVRGRKVITALSGLHCLFRVFRLPRVSEELFAEGISWEAKRVLPVSLEEFYLSWQIMSTSGEEVQVFLAALPRNATDALIETLRKADVKPYLMDLAPLALSGVASRSTAIIVDVRSIEVDIVIMVDGIPYLIRTLTLPGDAQPLQKKLPIIKEEIQRTVGFYSSSYPERPLEPGVPIFGSGELAEEPQTYQSLANALNYSVLPQSSPLECKDSVLSDYMVNIGLALKELPLGKRARLTLVNLNVLPEVYKRKPFPMTKVLIYLGIIVAVLLLGSLYMIVQKSAAEMASIQPQIDASNHLFKQRLQIQQSQKEEITELEKKVTELEVTYNTFAAVLNNFGRQQEIVNGDLKEATSADTLPDSVDLSSITYASVELNIKGMSPSETEVLTYANALRDSGRFSQVVISTIQETETGMDFNLTLRAVEGD